MSCFKALRVDDDTECRWGCVIIIAGYRNVVIYHRLVDSNKIIRPDLSADVIKLCGVSGEILWGWTGITRARPCAPDLASSARWRRANKPDLFDRAGQLSPLTARVLEVLDLQ
jgi:hypothetical protein